MSGLTGDHSLNEKFLGNCSANVTSGMPACGVCIPHHKGIQIPEKLFGYMYECDDGI